jgi:hypothetical protein
MSATVIIRGLRPRTPRPAWRPTVALTGVVAGGWFA